VRPLEQKEKKKRKKKKRKEKKGEKKEKKPDISGMSSLFWHFQWHRKLRPCCQRQSQTEESEFKGSTLLPVWQWRQQRRCSCYTRSYRAGLGLFGLGSF